MIIADDEKTILDGLKVSIDWRSFDIDVVGAAKNGIEALDMAQKLRPDIVLTDIRMPGLNGIELIKEIKKFCPFVKFILISAYEEFEFAKEAISLGVLSYITKPIKKQKVIDEVLKARDEIMEERHEKENMNKLEELYLSTLPILSEHYHNSLIMGKVMISGGYKSKFNTYGIDLDETDTGVFVFTLDRIDETTEELFEKSIQIILLMIAEMIKELLPLCYKRTVFQSYSNEVVAIYNASLNHAAAIKEITLTAEAIKNKVKHDTGISISAGVGRIYSSLKEISLSYQEAIRALNYRLVYGNNTVLYIDNVEMKEMKDAHLFNNLNEILTGVQDVLRTGKTDEVIKLIKSRLDKLTGYKSIPYYYVQQVYCHLLSVLLRTIYEMNILPEQLYGMPVHLYGELFKKETLPELEKWYFDLVERACTAINERKATKTSHVINSAVSYIKANCNKDISLGEVAEHVNLNPSYLSRLFKEETGIQFVEYVRTVKMEIAKDLLKNSNKKIYEICEELGYLNVQYFSTIFKNTVGVTPMEYKKSCV